MSWRTIATMLIVAFALLLTWAVLADPLVQIQNAFLDLETSGQLNADSRISANVSAWFNMILVGVFGVFVWAAWRVLRKELTRGRI